MSKASIDTILAVVRNTTPERDDQLECLAFMQALVNARDAIMRRLREEYLIEMDYNDFGECLSKSTTGEPLNTERFSLLFKDDVFYLSIGGSQIEFPLL